MKHVHEPLDPDAFYSICKVCEENISRASADGLTARKSWRISNSPRTRIMVGWNMLYRARGVPCE